MLNKLLQRQMQKHLDISSMSDEIAIFLKSVSASYDHFEQDRLMLERSIEISSAEMIELNRSQRQAHEDLTALFDKMEEVFFSLGFSENKLLQMSPACEKVYGYPLADFKANSNLWQELVVEEDKGNFNNSFSALYAGESISIEYRIHHKDGSLRWVETKISPTLDTSGNLIRIDGVTFDVTKRKNAEIATSYSENKFQNLFEKMLDGFYKSSMEGKFIEVNPALVKMLGYSSKEELLEIDIKSQLYFESSERDAAIEQERKDGISIFRLKKKDGTEIWVEDRGQYISDDDGKVIYHEGLLRDVTERIKGELDLRKSRKETGDYREALDQCLNVAITDQKGSITYANQNFCKTSGYTFDELVGKDLRIINSGYHTKDFFNELWKTIANGAVWRGEIKNKAKDGSLYWVDSTIVPFLNQAGKPYQYLSIRIDITEKKMSEIQLAEKEANYRTIIQSSNDLIQSVNAEGAFEFVNNSWLNTMGYTSEELSDMTIFDVISPEHLPICTSTFLEVLKGESLANIRTVFITKEGTDIMLEGNAVPKYDGSKIVGTQAFLRDVTEREKYQAELIEINDKLKITIDRLTESQKIAQLGSWILDIKSHTFLRSDVFYKIYECTAESYPTEWEGYLDLIHPDDRTMVNDAFCKACESHQPYHYEARLMMKDGRIKNIYANGKTITNEEGEAIKMHGTVQDVTDRKNTEQELEKNIIELKRSNSELDKFVYSVSHDLRAPLSSMLGVIEISEDDTTDENMLVHLGMLKKNIRKLDGFITDILDYSRNSRTDVKKEDINFNELLADITQNLKFMGGTNRQVDISISINSSIPVKSDKSRLNIILNNLVSNAIRYQNPQMPNPFVDIKVDTSDTETGIIIRDNGIGIRKDLHEKIFDMFYRVSEDSVGSGLGLYIVIEAVKKLKGHIEVQSEVGEGSTFIIKIPNK